MPGSPDDTPLLAGLAAGREDAFAAAYDRFAARLLAAAWGMLGSRADAEDAVQDVFVGLVRSRATLAGVEDLGAYLFASLRHAAARQWRHRGRERGASRAAGVFEPRALPASTPCHDQHFVAPILPATEGRGSNGAVPGPALGGAEDPRERGSRLDRALAALPREQREVMALKIDGGLTFAQVAAVLGIRPNTAASRYRYALGKLRRSLEEP